MSLRATILFPPGLFAVGRRRPYSLAQTSIRVEPRPYSRCIAPFEGQLALWEAAGLQGACGRIRAARDKCGATAACSASSVRNSGRPQNVRSWRQSVPRSPGDGLGSRFSGPTTARVLWWPRLECCKVVTASPFGASLRDTSAAWANSTPNKSTASRVMRSSLLPSLNARSFPSRIKDVAFRTVPAASEIAPRKGRRQIIT